MSKEPDIKPLDLEKENLLPKKEDEYKFSQRDIRSLAFHFIYAMEQLDYSVSLESIVDGFRKWYDLKITDDSKAIEIAKELINKRDELEEEIIPILRNWKLDRLGLCTRLILRMAIWELLLPGAIPSIVINEAIELAKDFAEKDAYKFINGVLDEVVKRKGLADASD